MRTLLTLDELLAVETNGWSCHWCGRAWLDTVPGLAVPISDPAFAGCRHPVLHRAMIQAPA